MTSLLSTTQETRKTPKTRRFETTWGVVALLLVVSFTLAHWVTRPAPDGDAGRRALATVERLQDLGVHAVGTEALSRGLDLVADELRAVPGIEVDRQRASGTYRFHTRDVDYSIENVVARQVGESDDALLVNVHVDSAFEGVGAADDGVAVGALVEAARQLAGERHGRTIVYLFNGGEEVGLTGADAFTRHPWARDVRWYLNLEAIGSGGLPILFQADQNGGALVDLAGNAPRPFGSIIGQTLFGAGLINSDTDSRVWRAAGWSGLDYAIFEDGYAYHTALDRVERLGPGTAQAFVDLTTHLARDLANDPDIGTAEPVPHYFDVQSRWWVTIDPAFAALLALALALAVAALVWQAHRAGEVRAGQVVASAGAALLGVLVAVLAGVVAGAVAWLVGGSQAWYAHPWVLYLVPLPLTVLGALAPQILLRRRRARRDHGTLESAPLVASHAMAAAVAFLGLVTAGLGIGAAYLLWTATALAVVALALRVPLRGRWRAVPLVVAALVQCLLVAEFARNLLTLAVPMLGRLPVAIPMDPVLGVVVALVGVLLAFALGPFVFHAGHVRRVAVATAVVTVAGLVVAAVVPPYAAERPKYVAAFHEQRDGADARIELEGRDFLTPQDLGLVEEVARTTGLGVEGDALKASDVAVPSGPVEFVGGGTSDPVEVRIGPTGANLTRITVEGAVTAVNGRTFDGGEAVLDVVGRPDGYTAVVERTGPVRIEVDQVFLETGPDLERVLAALPPWAVGHGRTLVQRTFADPGA